MYLCIEFKLSDIFITGISAPQILGMNKFYIWVTKGPIFTSFMSKLNYSRLSIHKTILLSPFYSQFKIELGPLIENCNYIKLLKKAFSHLWNQSSAFHKLSRLIMAGIKSMY